MNKVTSYFKNVSKSAAYATANIFTETLMPDARDFVDTNDELFKSIYATVSHAKKSLRYGKKVAVESQIYKDINTGINNVFEDIKTGNFYNQARSQASLDSAGEMMAGGFDDLEDMSSDDFSFDDFDFDFDDDDGSLDDFSDKPTKGDVVIADTVAKSSNLSAQLISKTVASTSEGIIKSNIATTNMTMAQNIELIAGVRTSIAGVHESINNVFNFMNQNITTQIDNQARFFTESTNIMKENNAFLKEIAEIQRNIYNKELEKEQIKDAYGDIYSGGGNVDLKEYFKVIGKNIKGLDKTGMLDALLADQGGSSMLSQFFSNPLGGFVQSIIKSYIPASFAKSVMSFSKSLGNLFPAFITKMNKWKEEDGIRGILGTLFGVKTDTKKNIDTSKYNKGPVPFDGITRKAIVDVIPEHLSRIESLLSGNSQRLYDYHTGKWLNTTDIKKENDKYRKDLIEDGFMDIDDDISTFVYELEKAKKLKAKDKKRLEADIFRMKELVFNNGGHFSPAQQDEFAGDPIMEALLDSLSRGYSNSKRMSVSARVLDNYRRDAQRKRDAEAGGDNILRKLDDKSNTNSHLEFDKTYDDQVVGYKSGYGMFNLKDKSGMNVLDYLRNILANVSFIREFGGSGGGKRRSSGKAPSFDKYSAKFDKATNPEHIQKLIEKDKKKDDSYDEHHKPGEGDKDLDVVLANAISKVQKNKYSDLDEDILEKFGTRFNDKNKYQKEADKIDGDSFIEKFTNASDAKQKKTVILGALSDVAKKPAGIIEDLIKSAEDSIYNFLFEAESDEWDEELGQKIKGFFPALMNQIRGAWDKLTVSIEEKILDPLADKFGLREKWDNVKSKIKESKPMDLLRNAGLKVKGALLDDGNAIGRFILEALGDVASPVINDPLVAGQLMKRNLKVKNKSQEKLLQHAISMGSSRYPKTDHTRIQGRLDLSKAIINKKETTNAGGTLRLTEDGWVFGHKGEALVPADQVDRATNAKVIKDIISNAKNNVISNDYRRNMMDLLNDHVRELVKAPDGIIASLEEFAPKSAKIADKYNTKNEKIKGKMNESGPVSAITTELGKAAATGANMFKSGLTSLTAAVTGAEGDTAEEQKASLEKKKNAIFSKIGKFLGDMDGEWAPMISKMIIGGGLGLLTGFAAGPIIGAGLGGAVSLAKNNKTVNEFLFGKDRKYNEDGTLESKEGGIISKEIQNTFKKYIPDAGKGAALGTIASFITPFGPLAGAAIGAGIGLAKNSTTLNKMLFGEEDGLINADRKEKLKKYLPKAGIGAAAGMLLGPFGLVGNAAIGAGVGLLTGTDEFKDLILGAKDANGDRIGGIKGALQEHFIDPIKDFGINLKDDFFGFIKESMIDPLNGAITPIAEEIAFQTKRVVFGIPKWFGQLGKDYIATPLLNKINDKLIDPVAKGIKGLFGNLFSRFKGLVSLPFRAVGGVGKAARKHQIKQGRDVVGKSAKDRLSFADNEGLLDYKYRDFDTKLAENADNEEWLEQLTARTGMLAYGSDHFDKEVKKARNQLSRVVADYYKLGWFSKDKKSYKRIRQYIHDNDVEAAIEELTEIQKSRTTGGPLGSEAGEAITRFNRANKTYQAARDRRDKFGNIKDEDHAAWMEEQFGPNWRKMNSERLFKYASKELHTATGRSVGKSDILTDPRAIVTKGESEIKGVLDDIYNLLNGDKSKFHLDADEEAYNKAETAGIANAKANQAADRKRIQTKLNAQGFNLIEVSPILDYLYENPHIYELVLSSSLKGINYDHATIIKLCKLKLTKKEAKLLAEFPYVAFADEKVIKKNLNYKRNDHGTITNNSLIGAKAIRNDNLAAINNEQKADHTYIHTDHGPKRYVYDDDGKLTLDTSDAETQDTVLKEKEDQETKKSFMDSMKNGVLGLFNRNKEKDEEEKKEPWYKKLFNMDLGTGIKLGAGILALITGITAIKKMINPTDSDGSSSDSSSSQNPFISMIGEKLGTVLKPAITTVHDWFTNEGEYAASDKGLSGFMDKVVFPGLFSGMNVFFGKVLPAVVTAFIKNIPTMVSAGIRGVGELFGWKRDKNNNDATVSRSDAVTSSGAKVQTDNGSSWLSKVLSDSTSTANNINSITFSEDGTNTTQNNDFSVSTYANIDGGNSTANGVISNASANMTPNANTSGTTPGDPNEPVEMEGIGPIYKKVKGKLVPITAGEFMKITEFWNAEGNGHWVLDEKSGQFIADSGTATDKGLPATLTYAAVRSALTHRTPAIFGKLSKGIFGGMDKTLSKIPKVGTAYSIFSTPVKGVASAFDKVTKAGKHAGESFDKHIKNASEAGKFDRGIKDKWADWKSSRAAKQATKAGPSIGNAAKSFDKYDKGLWNKVVNYCKNGLTKIFGTKVVRDKVGDAVKESAGAKIAKGAKALDSQVNKIVKSSIDKIMAGIVKHLPNTLGKAVSKIAAGTLTAGILTGVFIVQDFLGGIDKAEAILGIKEPNALQTLIAGLTNVIVKELLFGLVETHVVAGWMIDWILPLFNVDTSQIKAKQDEVTAEVKAYNLANGDNLSTQEYLERNHSVSGKLKNVKDKAKTGIKNAWSSTKSGVGNFVTNTGQKLKEGFTSIADNIKEKFDKTLDVGKYVGIVIKDAFTDVIQGKNVETKGIKIDEDDPNYAIKEALYSVTKITTWPVTTLVRIGKGIYTEIFDPIIKGVTSIGKGIGTNIKGFFTESWKGNFLKAMAKPGVDTGHPASDIISKVITGVFKPILAPFGLMTSGVGVVARNIEPISEGFKTIGSSIVSSVTDRFKNAWNGDLSSVLKNNNPNTGNALVDKTAAILNGIVTFGTAVPALGASAIGAGVRAIDKVIDSIKKISQNKADKQVLEDANKGDIKFWDSKYWKISGAPDGIAGTLYKFNSYLQKVLNLPSALLGMLNPLNWDISDTGKKLLQKTAKFLGFEDEFKEDYTYDEAGEGTRRRKSRSGRGSGDFVSQVDPKYANKRFNTGRDTERQTLGDSGCAPATAANVVNFYAGQGTEFENAANAALRYKDINSGVTPDYFENYLGNKGISTYSTNDKKTLMNSIQAGNPTILLGQDSSGRSNTPYGPASSHYVLATGMDGKGNVIVQDPESRQPNTVYPAKDLINQSHLGMVTSRASGRGSRGKFSRIKSKINSRVLAGRGSSKEQIEQKVWKALRSAGYSEVQTAGVMGNIKHESGFNPSVVEKGSGIGFGLCQWSFGRRTQIEKFAKSLGKSPNNVDVQIVFLLAEMTPGGGANGYASYQFSKSSSKYDGRVYSRDTFKNAKDIETATKAFCFCWERPSYDPKVNHISSRISSAKEYYKKYTGLDPQAVSIGDDSSYTTTESTSSDLFSMLGDAFSSYYDKDLLKLLGFAGEEEEVTDTTSTDSTTESYNGKYTGGKLEWPVPGYYTISSPFGPRKAPKAGASTDHRGIDISTGGKKGPKIVAAEAGKVILATYGGSYGNHIIIDHGGLYTLYAHCNKLVAKVGDKVSRGQKIAEVGTTGNSTGPHLHFEVRKGTNSYSSTVNPMSYLKTTGKGSGKVKKMITLAGKGTTGNMAAIKTSNPEVNGFVHIKGNKYTDPATGAIVAKSGNSYISTETRAKIFSNKNGNITFANTKSAANLDNGGVLSGKGSSIKLNKNASFKLPAINNTSFKPSTVSGDTIEYGNRSIAGRTSSNTDKLLSVIIEVLGVIANNSEKLSEIVSLLSKALDVNLTNEDISNLSSNNAKIKNKIANALKAQGSPTGMGSSVMNSTTESLAAAMYSIASA